MNFSSLPPEDLPPKPGNHYDALLRRQLEESMVNRLYAQCDRTTRMALGRCEWRLITGSSTLTLAINCRNSEAYWRILSETVLLGSWLSKFTDCARIRINPPPGEGRLLEIRIEASY